jgi:hypothetical protein
MANRRVNGTRSDARSAGTTDRPHPSRAARPVVPPAVARRAQKRIADDVAAELGIEPLELRARAWHFEWIGAGCECADAGAYPCQDCQNETGNLLALLQAVVAETLAARTVLEARAADVPIGRRP